MHENGTEKKYISKNMHFKQFFFKIFPFFHLVEVYPCAIDPYNINCISNSSRLFLTIIRFISFHWRQQVGQRFKHPSCEWQHHGAPWHFTKISSAPMQGNGSQLMLWRRLIGITRPTTPQATLQRPVSQWWCQHSSKKYLPVVVPGKSLAVAMDADRKGQ